MTYNHERYVADAIESVLSQQTSFPFELLITEDCSTDSTRKIIHSFRDRHPDRIGLLLSPVNLNDNSVLSRGVLAAKGCYVALLDGDDWWTSPDKLQKQVDFLDRRPDCSICFHNVQVVYEGGGVRPHPYHLDYPSHRISAPMPAAISGLSDLVKGNFIQTCSVMLRAKALQGIPSWYVDLPIGDWPLYILYAQNGTIGYLDEILAAYRVHHGGLWSRQLSRHDNSDDIRRMIETCDLIDRHLGQEYHDSIRRSSSYLHRAAAVALLRQGDYGPAVRHWRQYAACVGPWRAVRDKAFALAAARGSHRFRCGQDRVFRPADREING